MYAVSPKDLERFSLRLLLLHVKGATSFDDLRTVNGILHQNFKEAAVAMNLLNDDKEWDNVMEEAVVFRMPRELRNLFAAILSHGEVTHPLELYNKYKESMFEDLLLTHSEFMAEQQALKDIDDNLRQFGRSLKYFGLPVPDHAYEMHAVVDFDMEKQVAAEMLQKMNSEQRTAFQIIMDAVNGDFEHFGSKNKCFFLSGAGGCGKTFVYKALTSQIISQGGIVKAVAPTGLAATLLKGGKTVHSGFGIPINLDERTTSRFKQTSPEYQELKKVKLIIWDEISMCHAHLLNAVDRSLRFLLDCSDPFGGIPIVVGGDFQQQAPVVLRGNRVKTVEACVMSSFLWKHFTELKLIQNMRVNDGEMRFCSWLLRVGSGLDANGNPRDFVKLPENILTNDIIINVFGSNIFNLSAEEIASRAILCPKNSDTLQINEKVMGMLPGETKTYCSCDTIEADNDEERDQYPMEFLHSLTPMGLPPHILNLKIGCCVMLLRNLNPKRGLCNGTRLIVERLGNNVLECVQFSGDHQGEKVMIPRILLNSSTSELPFTLNRKQFPLRLAYSMTITKSQGQTFDRIGVLLPEPVFSHGQLYTAFSRVRSENGLFVQIREGSKQGKIYENDESVYTYNCVYREIL